MLPLSGLRRLRRQTVLVHLLTPDPQTFRGVLIGDYRDSIALAHVRHMDEENDLKGELVIPKARIDYFQVVGE